jgi:hypothetical protein
MNINDWDLYYNLEGEEYVRANLVYTPYVSPDKKTICMSFNRDRVYHKNEHENILWTDEMLTDRFSKELEFHTLASNTIPTLKLLDVDTVDRKIFFEWHRDDFLMQGLKAGGYNKVLPDWQEQWLELIKNMRDVGIYKISLHPNSWIAHQGQLIPWNWFFCYHRDSEPVTFRSLLPQISAGRLEKLVGVLADQGVDLDTACSPHLMQRIAFNSFRYNYPKELIDNVLLET